MATRSNASDRPPPTRFHFIGGKGGVGKTTLSAALAVAAAARGERVLVASTDPAPSLGDALQVPLGRTPRRVAGAAGQLLAVEIDAPTALKRWLDERRPLLERIAVDGTWLDRQDVERLLRLSLPGVDELAALMEIDRLASSSGAGLVIVDTAPTGHTLRMLATPDVLLGIARVFDRMREKQRVVQEALRGAWTEGPEDRLIDELSALAAGLRALLRDGRRTTTEWVTLAEPLSIAETRDALEALAAAQIPVSRVIANRVTPAPQGACGHCRARRAFEAAALRGLSGAVPVAGVPALDVEPRGVRALKGIVADPAVLPRAARPSTWRAPVPASGRTDPGTLVPDSMRLVLLGGKGGVGKTTCAAALAVSVARKWPRRRVLLMSTDPAHSLADVFEARVGDVRFALPSGPENLAVHELDPRRVFDDVQRRYADAIEGIFDRLRGGGSFDAAHDRAVMRSLIDLAPPGLDELAAVLETTSLLREGVSPFDIILIDTAPTGHALRLLEMPALVHDWVKALMAILLKYQGVTPVGDLATLLITLSRGLTRLRELLTDPESAAFIAVTRPAALPRLETERLLKRLDRLGIAAPAVIVNAIGRGSCARCRKAAAAQRRELGAVRRVAGPRRRLVWTPLHLPAPQGCEALARWSRSWRSSDIIEP